MQVKSLTKQKYKGITKTVFKNLPLLELISGYGKEVKYSLKSLFLTSYEVNMYVAEFLSKNKCMYKCGCIYGYTHANTRAGLQLFQVEVASTHYYS